MFLKKIKVIKVKINDELGSSHSIYYKHHSLIKSTKNEDGNSINKRIIFVSNIPTYFNDQCLKNIFGSFGKIEKVQLESKPISNPFSNATEAENSRRSDYFMDKNVEVVGFKIGYILFSEVSSVEKAIKKYNADKERILCRGSSQREGLINTGIKSLLSLAYV